ncbi:hypothetical protein [Rhodanobacter umsongensis]
MDEKRIYVPSVPLDADLGVVFETFWREIRTVPPKSRVTFDFRECKELRAAGLVMIAGAYGIIRIKNRASFRLDIKSMRSHVYEAFNISGCGGYLGICDPVLGKAPFRHDLTDRYDDVIDYLKDVWLSRIGFTVSKEVQSELVGKVAEVYANAFEHGQSQQGVFSCAEVLPEDAGLQLVVADFGVGIPHNAEQAIGEPVSGEEAMRWAFTEGNTTLALTQRYPRGLGLTLLSDLVKLNDGCLELFSYSGHSRVTSNGQSFRTVDNLLPGTIVSLRLKPDGKHYYFDHEQPSEDTSPWL